MHAPPRNVVLLVLDTARYDEVFTARSNPSPTPFLDELVADGTAYTSTFAQAPWTLPSHASLFTGTPPSKHGAHAGHERLGPDHLTLPEAFADAGYETVAVSNNTWISGEFGFERGFETFHRTWQYVQSETDLGRVARENEGAEMFRALASELASGNPLVNLANAFYGKFARKRTDDGARRTNEWIRNWLGDRDGSSPFFLFVNYLEPHLEYRPPREFAERFLPADVPYGDAMDVPQDAWKYVAGKIDISEREFAILRALYRAEVAYLDHRLAELRRTLEDHDEWDRTVLVVTSDHGENVGDHGLMDHQYCLYDTLLHVPLVVHGGSFTGGGSVDDLVQLTDLAPTLLDETGVDAPAFRAQLQGRSVHPDADAEPRERVVAEYVAPQPSMEALESRVGDLPEDVLEYDRSLRAIRTREWKLIRGSDGSTELYHVAVDPDEAEDVSGRNPDVVSDLGEHLDRWVESFEHARSDDPVEIPPETRSRLEDFGYLG